MHDNIVDGTRENARTSGCYVQRKQRVASLLSFITKWMGAYPPCPVNKKVLKK